MTIRARRWSDNDRYFGPFTYARSRDGYRPLALILNSGDDDERPGCSLRFSAFGHTLIAVLPSIIRPWRIKHQATTWNAETVARLERDWYWETGPREYGFSYVEGFLDVRLGRVTHDSTTEQRWGCHLPWTQWRLSRFSIFGFDGVEVFRQMEQDRRRRVKAGANQGEWFKARQEAKEAAPVIYIPFVDYDGEQLVMRGQIHEREWLFGEGWFRWLSLFRRPMVRRSLSMRFSGETGRRKGSWKGGTLGTDIDIHPGEPAQSAFARYCIKNNMASALITLDLEAGKAAFQRPAPAPASEPQGEATAAAEAPKRKRGKR